jgi:hypothetical protein
MENYQEEVDVYPVSKLQHSQMSADSGHETGSNQSFSSEDTNAAETRSTCSSLELSPLLGYQSDNTSVWASGDECSIVTPDFGADFLDVYADAIPEEISLLADDEEDNQEGDVWVPVLSPVSIRSSEPIYQSANDLDMSERIFESALKKEYLQYFPQESQYSTPSRTPNGTPCSTPRRTPRFTPLRTPCTPLRTPCTPLSTPQTCDQSCQTPMSTTFCLHQASLTWEASDSEVSDKDVTGDTSVLSLSSHMYDSTTDDSDSDLDESYSDWEEAAIRYNLASTPTRGPLPDDSDSTDDDESFLGDRTFRLDVPLTGSSKKVTASRSSVLGKLRKLGKQVKNTLTQRRYKKSRKLHW